MLPFFPLITLLFLKDSYSSQQIRDFLHIMIILRSNSTHLEDVVGVFFNDNTRKSLLKITG